MSIKLSTLKRVTRFLTLILIIQMFISGKSPEQAKASEKPQVESDTNS